jgi:hypothetical protein
MPAKELHPDYISAKERGLVEVYIPDHYVKALEGRQLYEDWEIGSGRGLLDLGYRISPEGMRSLLLASLTYVVEPDVGKTHMPRNEQSWMADLAYGLYTDLLRDEDVDLLRQGKTFRDHLSQTEGDFYESPVHHRLHNKVIGTMEEVALDIFRRKSKDPEIKTLFFHGTWNRMFPHQGQILNIKDVIAELRIIYGVDLNKLVVVVGADTNGAIEAVGKIPIADSMMRMSSLSYLPYVDYVTSTGNITSLGKKIRSHYIYKYQVLSPDYLFVGDDHPRKDEIETFCKVHGIEAISYPRIGEWDIPEPGKPFSTQLPNPISSRNIELDVAHEFSVSNTTNHMLGSKRIMDDLHGKRRWFDSRFVVIPDKNRGVTVEAWNPMIEKVSQEHTDGLILLR